MYKVKKYVHEDPTINDEFEQLYEMLRNLAGDNFTGNVTIEDIFPEAADRQHDHSEHSDLTYVDDDSSDVYQSTAGQAQGGLDRDQFKMEIPYINILNISGSRDTPLATLVGEAIELTSGTGSGQQRIIIAENVGADTQLLQLNALWAIIPDNTTRYRILAPIEDDHGQYPSTDRATIMRANNTHFGNVQFKSGFGMPNIAGITDDPPFVGARKVDAAASKRYVSYDGASWVDEAGEAEGGGGEVNMFKWPILDVGIPYGASNGAGGADWQAHVNTYSSQRWDTNRLNAAAGEKRGDIRVDVMQIPSGHPSMAFTGGNNLDGAWVSADLIGGGLNKFGAAYLMQASSFQQLTFQALQGGAMAPFGLQHDTTVGGNVSLLSGRMGIRLAWGLNIVLGTAITKPDGTGNNWPGAGYVILGYGPDFVIVWDTQDLTGAGLGLEFGDDGVNPISETNQLTGTEAGCSVSGIAGYAIRNVEVYQTPTLIGGTANSAFPVAVNKIHTLTLDTPFKLSDDFDPDIAWNFLDASGEFAFRISSSSGFGYERQYLVYPTKPLSSDMSGLTATPYSGNFNTMPSTYPIP